MSDALERALDPARFARVWKRVAPAEDACPVEVAQPKGSACPKRETVAGESGAYLRRRIEEELCRWRCCQGLAALCGRSAALGRLSHRAYRRARRLAAALFLTTGGWYFPAGVTRPRRGKGLRSGLRELYRGSQRAEREDRQAAERFSDPALRALLLALAEESREEQKAIFQLLSGNKFDCQPN
ncbi:MAG: hypothetical protein LUD78_06760 [Clostridiales bacterium]|nr:hypothetical protein [Clostridiales bacterium]